MPGTMRKKYRNPVMILIDGVIGVMMEPIELPDMVSDEFLAEKQGQEEGGVCGWPEKRPHREASDQCVRRRPDGQKPCRLDEV